MKKSEIRAIQIIQGIGHMFNPFFYFCENLFQAKQVKVINEENRKINGGVFSITRRTGL